MKSIVSPLIKLVIFALVTVVATTMLALTIMNAGNSGDHEFSAIFTDAAMLNAGDEVTIAGTRVGTVTDVEVYERRKAKVSFTLDRKTLPDGVNLFIRYRNLVGLRYLALERGAGDANRAIKAGAMITENTHPALNMTELFNGFRPLFQQLTAEDVNKLSDEMIKVFQGESNTLAELVRDTASLTNTIANKDAVIGDLITNLTKVLNNINTNDQQFSELLTTTERFVTGLAQQRGSVGAAISSISNLTEVTGNILSRTRPSIQGSLAGLNQISQAMLARTEFVEKSMENLPKKLVKVGRAASFGSWFQFYLCGLDIAAGNGKSVLLNQPLISLPTINHVLYTNAATRCWADKKRR